MNTPKDDMKGINFNSKKLEKRFLKIVEKLTNQPGKSILEALGNRSDAKAAYRMLANEDYSNENVKKEYAKSTMKRMEENSTVLVIQDTTELNYNTHKKTTGLGYCNEYSKGLIVHNCIAITPEGIAIGMLDQRIHTRTEKKDTSKTKEEKKKQPIEEKESYRWLETYDESMKYIPETVNAITICDREGDFYELYAHIIETKGKAIIRLVHDRVIEEEDMKSLEYLRGLPPCGTITVDIPRDTRKGKKARTATLEVNYGKITFKKPANRKETHLPKEITVNAVHIIEVNVANGEEAVEWFLATTEEVKNFDDAVKIVEYYVQRWKIERFHYVLKEGCKAEKIQERTCEKKGALIYIYSIISIYIMSLTYLARTNLNISCDVLFDETEWRILYCAANKTKESPEKPYSIREAVRYLAKLGGFAGSPSDGDPGVKVIWRGLEKLYTLVDYHEFINI